MVHMIRLGLGTVLLGLALSGCGNRPCCDQAPQASPRVAERDPGIVVHDFGPNRQEMRPSQPKPPSDKIRRDVSLEEIRKYVQSMNAVLIDARSPKDFASGHVRGALNLPPSQMDAYMPEIWKNVTPDQLIIIYCASAMCESGDMVYEYLAAQGFTNMRVFGPGWRTLASATDLR